MVESDAKLMKEAVLEDGDLLCRFAEHRYNRFWLGCLWHFVLKDFANVIPCLFHCHIPCFRVSLLHREIETDRETKREEEREMDREMERIGRKREGTAVEKTLPTI